MAKIYQKAYEYEIRFVIQYARGRVVRMARNAVTADNWKSLWADIESMSQQVDRGLKDCMHVETLDIRESVGRLEAKAERIEVAVLVRQRVLRWLSLCGLTRLICRRMAIEGDFLTRCPTRKPPSSTPTKSLAPRSNACQALGLMFSTTSRTGSKTPRRNPFTGFMGWREPARPACH